MGQSYSRVWDNPIRVATDTCDTRILNKYFYRVPTILRNGTEHLIPQNTYFAEHIEMGPKQLPSLVVIYRDVS